MTKFEITQNFIDKLKIGIKNKDENYVHQLVKGVHPADIAEIYDSLNIDEAKFVYLLLDGDMAADVIAELEDDDREKFLKVLPNEVIAERFIKHMDSDDAADIIGEMEENRQSLVLSKLKDTEQASDIIDLLKYNEDTAGGLMAKEYIAVNINWDVKKCLEEVKKQAEEVDELYNIYVLDDDKKLKGIVSTKKLIISNENTKVNSLLNADIISVNANKEAEYVSNIMDKYGLVALPVIDKIGRLIGRITIDDVVDFIREEAEKDYQMASGLTSDVESSDKIFVLTKARLPWLIVGLVGGVFAAQILGIFEEDMAALAATAFFIPLIAAMGGNVGVQSSAIVVQGLAANTLNIDSTFKRIFKEFSVAFINGLICSLLLLVYNLIVGSNFVLTISVSIALFLVIIFASTFGTLVPLALNKFKIDPALATGPFITTANDIIGLFIYLYTVRIIYGMV